MGCVYSKNSNRNSRELNIMPPSSTTNTNNNNNNQNNLINDPNEINGNLRKFKVVNVDEGGHSINRGEIQISSTDLILRQGDSYVSWPLRSLRRYGFDERTFSFECGRRCQTGPGIYAFNCSEAVQLFTTLQEAINRCTTTPFTLHPPASSSAGIIQPSMNNQTPLPSPSPVGMATGGLITTTSGNYRSEQAFFPPDDVNLMISPVHTSVKPSGGQMVSSCMRGSVEANNDDANSCNQSPNHNYVNTVIHNYINSPIYDGTPVSEDNNSNNYANHLICANFTSASSSSQNHKRSSSASDHNDQASSNLHPHYPDMETIGVTVVESTEDYSLVETNPGSVSIPSGDRVSSAAGGDTSQPSSPSTREPKLSYAVIDFEKTEALMTAANQRKSNWDTHHHQQQQAHYNQPSATSSASFHSIQHRDSGDANIRHSSHSGWSQSDQMRQHQPHNNLMNTTTQPPHLT